MNACRIAGSELPTFSVPGIRSTGTIRHIRKSAVVGANDPIPSVSKKFVTKPMADCSQVGAPRSPGARLIARTHTVR